MLSQKRCRGTLAYKIIIRDKLVNVSQNCGRIEMSSAGVRRDGGRLFHARGAATGKARSPRVDLQALLLWMTVDDGGFPPAVRRMFSARYAGADPLRQRCVKTQRRNVIRSGTRSQ